MAGRQKKPWIIFVIVVLVIALLVMGISFATKKDRTVPGDGIVGAVLKPFQVAVSFVGEKFGGMFHFLGDVKELREENLELSHQIDVLQAENRELKNYRTENQRLRELLSLKESGEWGETIGCDIIAKDPGNWFNIFTVDKGVNAGISINDVCVTAKGLVGRVVEVGPNTAKVISIIDAGSSVGAIVTRTQDIAVADGELALLEEGLCRLNYVTSGANLVNGDTIETSGLGGIYPKGILIGTVTEVKDSVSGMSGYAIIKPAVDFERIREVLIIKQK